MVSSRGNCFTGPRDLDHLLFFHVFHEPDFVRHQFGLKRREPLLIISGLYLTVVCDYDNPRELNVIAAFF